MGKKKHPTDSERLNALFADGHDFAREVNEWFNNECDGDITNPKWLDYCKQMDELAA